MSHKRGILIPVIGLAGLLALGAMVKLARREAQQASDVLTAETLARNAQLFKNDAHTAPADHRESFDTDRLHRSIDEAAQFLVRSCDRSGQFVYRVNMDPEVRVRRKYNMLRHGGTIYSLAMHGQWRKDTSVIDAAVRAVGFLRKRAVGEVEGHPGLLTVWSNPKLVGRKAPLQAKLGGSGLALVAATSLEKLAPGTTPLEELQQLAKFIVFMQKDDGSFYSKYIPTEGGRNDEFVSLFYPGEAALGLTMLYELDPNPQWLNTALHALGYLCELREGKKKVPPDHWALIATSLVLKHYEKSDRSSSREQLIEHAEKIVAVMVRGWPRGAKNAVSYGTLGSDGRTTPTATRLEGLLAAYSADIPRSAKRRKRLTKAFRQGIAFLLRAQVRSGEHKGGMPRAIAREPGKSRSYNDRATEIRIDYVQHAMSAMIQYDELFNSPR